MTLSIDDLFTAQTSDEIRASMVTTLVSLGIPADKWKPGGVASTILTVASMSLALMSTLIASLIQGFFLPTATSTSLKLLAKYMYGVTVPDATFASGNVTLTNTGGGVFNIAIGGLIVKNASTKVTYTNDAAFTLSGGQVLDVFVIAQTAGSGGNAAPGAITDFVTVLLGVTCTNAASLVGVDAPTDEAIRTLCLNKLGALSVRGVRTAYAYAVQTATNPITGSPVNINRWSISGSSSTGTVTVIVASPTGAADPDDVQGVADNIEAIARPEAVTVTVSSATTVADTDSIIVTCKMPSGVTSAQTKDAIDEAIVEFIATYPIGGEPAVDDTNPVTPITGLFASGIYGAIAAAVAELGGLLIACQGATDHVLTSTQVATDSITTTIRLIPLTSGTTVV